MRAPALAALALLLLPGAAAARPGELDRRFGGSGQVRIVVPRDAFLASDIAVQPDGRLVVVGTSSRHWRVVRLTAGGRPDRTFGKLGRATVRQVDPGAAPRKLALMPDGRIVIAGTTGGDGSGHRLQVVRLLPDGRPDPSFGDGGRATISVPAPARVFFGGADVQSDGGVVVAGTVHDGDQRLVVWRLGPDGRQDAGFGAGGAYVDGEPGDVRSILARPDGRLIVAGRTGSYYAPNRELLLALTADGRVDPSWATAGRLTGPRNAVARVLAPAPEGGVVVLDELPWQNSVLWLLADGTPRESWGLEGRTGVPDSYASWADRDLAVDGEGRVYVASAGRYTARGEPQEVAQVVRFATTGVADPTFGRRGVARLPRTKRTRRSAGEAIAIGRGDSAYLAASGITALQEFREDFAYTHSVVARLKTWPQIADLWLSQIRPGTRRLSVTLNCRIPCRGTITVADRRGRRLGRTPRSLKGTRRVSIRLRRRLRPRERLTLRLQASEPGGRADVVVRRVRVQRRPR